MDKKIVEDGVQNVSDFNSKKILIGGEKSTALSPAPVKKLGIIENKILESNKIACQTPEKINETLHHKVQEGEIKIPDKWVTLCLIIFLLLIRTSFSESYIWHLSLFADIG